MPISVRQGVEVFHLALLAELGTTLDRALYALKGGCNLRFFFQSIRYSEDLDLDVATVAVTTLRRKVDRVLGSAPLRRTLGAHTIAIEHVSRPKQTETTQRWKVGLTIGAVAAHTKVELSRRGLDAGIEFGAVSPSLTGEYGLTRTLLSHYGPQAAVEQKLRALVGRAHTQARDVFDLDLLLTTGRGIDLASIAPELRQAALERAMSVEFDAFRSQVLSFLPADRQAQYDSKGVWEDMVVRLVDALGAKP